MTSYLSTFISGFDVLISRLIKDDIKDIKNIRVFDGAITYQTNLDIKKIQSIRYFNNSFIILRQFNYNVPSSTETLNKIIQDILNNRKTFTLPNILIKTFKIFSSLENKLVPVDGKLMYKLVDMIKAKTGKPYNARSSDTEFWILYRSEKVGFFMLRITKNKKKLNKGELSQELTNLLCQLSKPQEEDVFLDPFCGTGAISLERSRIAGFRGIFAMDKNEDLIRGLKNKNKKLGSKLPSFFIPILKHI